MTDPRLTQIEAYRNEIKMLASSLHTLQFNEMKNNINELQVLSGKIFSKEADIKFNPYVEGTFSTIETYVKSSILYVRLDDEIFLLADDGNLCPSSYDLKKFIVNPEVEPLKHVSDCIINFYSFDVVKEVTGEDMKIGFSEEKYGGWGFSNKGHDYMFYKGGAVRKTST